MQSDRETDVQPVYLTVCVLVCVCMFISRSVSMIDMRGEEVGLQPHCQARHEGIHSQYHRMKDDDDHWQDVSTSTT